MAALLEEGGTNRTISATGMNKTSSRSHCIFTMRITQAKEGDAAGSMVSQLVLIDLAGSERAGTAGAAALQEAGKFINKSLSALGKCIAALVKGGDGHIPFRESTLTWLIKDALFGNSMVSFPPPPPPALATTTHPSLAPPSQAAMIAAISPANVNYEETLSTLRWASSAKHISCKVVKNEDPTQKLIDDLKAEIDALKAALAGQQPGGGGGGGEGTTLATAQAALTALAGTRDNDGEDAMAFVRKRRLQRKASRVFVLSENADKSAATPQLKYVSDDPSAPPLRVYIARGQVLTVGRPDAEREADLKLDGIGMARDHCTIERSADGVDSPVSIVPVGEAACFVNGASVRSPTLLRNGAHVCLGTCAHFFVFLDPRAGPAPAAMPHHDTLVREVVRRRVEGAEARQARIANMAVSRWQRPRQRRVFEDTLINALRAVSEANDLSATMMAKVRCSCDCYARLLGCADTATPTTATTTPPTHSPRAVSPLSWRWPPRSTGPTSPTCASTNSSGTRLSRCPSSACSTTTLCGP